MFTIELKKVLRESLIIFLLLLTILILIIATDKDIYLAPVFEIFLLMYASFSGWSIFNKEKNEGAMEYLLSLPISKVRLLLIKLIPRMIILSFLLVCHILLHYGFEFPFFLNITNFSMFYFTFLLVSLSLSLSLNSFISTFLLTSILAGGFTMLIHYIDMGKSESTVYLYANASLLFFPILFFIMFRYYDINPTYSFNKKFAIWCFLILIITVGINFLFTGKKWCQHFLTKNKAVLRLSCGETQILKENKVVFKYKGCQYPINQLEDLLYVQNRGGKSSQPTIDIIDLKTGEKKLLYNIPKDFKLIFDSPLNTGILKNNELYILFWSKIENIYYLLIISKEKTKKIPIDINLNITEDDWYEVLLTHVKLYGKPHQFFIKRNDTLYRFDESGKGEKVLRAKEISTWKNRLLVFNDNRMTLYDIKENGNLKIIWEKNERIQKITRKYGSIQQKIPMVKSLEKKEFYSFNIENLKFTKIPMPYYPKFYLDYEDQLIIIWLRDNLIIIGNVGDEKFLSKKKWIVPIDFSSQYGIQILNSGIIVFNQKEYKTFWFND